MNIPRPYLSAINWFDWCEFSWFSRYLRIVFKAFNPFNFHNSYFQWAFILIERHSYINQYINAGQRFIRPHKSMDILIVVNYSQFILALIDMNVFNARNVVIKYTINAHFYLINWLKTNGSSWVVSKLSQWK